MQRLWVSTIILTFKHKRDTIRIVMKAMAPIENTETARKQTGKVSLTHFVIFATLFGAWLTLQFIK